MTKKTNNYEGRVFWANQKFFDQKVSDLFRGEGNKTSKHFPTYFGVRRHDLEVYVERYEGKFYLSFKQMGYACGDYSKRIRKTMTMAEIDTLIAEYYDREDEAHKKCVESYNAAFAPKKTKKETKTSAAEPVAEVKTENETESATNSAPVENETKTESAPKTLKVTLNTGEVVLTSPQSHVIQVYQNGRWENIAVFNPDQYTSALNASKWIDSPNVQLVTLY